MSEENSSAVSEALPANVIYAPSPAPAETLESAREKMLQRGPGALSNTDLIAVILAPCRRQLAQRLMRRHGLSEIANLTLPVLLKSHSLGKGSALRLAAVLELARRLRNLDRQERLRLNNPREVYHEVRDIRRARKEHLVGLYLDAQNQLVHRETVSIGTLNTTRTHPREILYPAVVHSASAFVLSHNHPSGNLEPSTEDVEFTRAIRRAGELMGIELYDHLVVSERGYTSLRERGLL